MPQLKVSTPQSLEDLCLTAVIRCLETDLVLCHVAKGLSSSSLLLRRIDLSKVQIAKQLSDYLMFLPGTLSEMVRQKITTRVIKKYVNSVNARGQKREITPFHSLPINTMTLSLLEIVLDEGVHSFDLSELVPVARSKSSRPLDLHDVNRDPELWELVLHRCPALRKFCLPLSLSAAYSIDLSSFITSLASQCHLLTELVVKDAFQDSRQVLSALGKHCPLLRVLDITGSSISCTDLLYLIFPDLTEEEVVGNYGPKSRKIGPLPNLPTGYKESRLCSKMRDLIVSDTRVRSTGVYYALKYLKNLESLGVCYHIASGIRKHVLEGFCSFQLKQAHTRGLNKEKIVLVCSACPKLETLSISSGCNPQFSFKLHYLNKVTYLKSLTLESASSLDLTGLKYSDQLTELKLQVPDVDIAHIAEGCPHLKRLVMTYEPRKVFKLTVDRTKQSIFAQLEELQVDSPMTLKVAEFIITEAKLLKTVKLVRVKKLTDQVLLRWLDLNPLLFLETWLLIYAHLTVRSVRLLLNRCPTLSTIGRLSGWDVRSWDSQRLQKVWNAYDINLVLFSDKQEDVAQIIDATASSDEE